MNEPHPTPGKVEGAPPSAPAVLELDLASDPDALDEARIRIRAALQSRGLPDAAVRALDLALEELAGNVIRHAFDDGEEHVIGVEIRVGDGGLTLILIDDGRPFDPTRGPPPVPLAPPGSIGARVPSGGLARVREVVRSWKYRRVEAHNVLEIELAVR